MNRPNILIVMVDQLSGTFFPDGGAADFLHAPHLKALAARSARFANAYTTSPSSVTRNCTSWRVRATTRIAGPGA
jgi:arylsulfatase A-like enzyme